MKEITDEELDGLIRAAVAETPPLSPVFVRKTAERLLARHGRRQRRRLYARGAACFLLALAGTFGLAWLISAEAARGLLAALMTYRWALLFGMAVLALGMGADGALLTGQRDNERVLS